MWQSVSIVLTDSLKKLLIETAFQLKGSAKRKFMAQTVQGFGLGGQRLAASELGWNRDTIRKGAKGRKKTCRDAKFRASTVSQLVTKY